MLLFLSLAIAVTAVLCIRLAGDANTRRALWLVGGVALGVRLLAVLSIYLVAIRTHGEGVWLNDEASYYLATESLLPTPWLKRLPVGLDHLAGNGYLGVTTTVGELVGMDATSFRLVNAMLGASVAVLTFVIANRIFGRRVGIAAGLLVGVWPTLVLWSGTILRDTLGSFLVLSVWWTLSMREQLGWARVLSAAVIGIGVAWTLRPYLAVAIAIGVLAWLLYPHIRRVSRGTVLASACALLVGLVVVGKLQETRIDFTLHELLYRQTTTRLETLGKLYHDPPPPGSPPPEWPFGPGVAVALVDPHTGWLLTGVIQTSDGPGQVTVAFTDTTIRGERISDLTLLQSAPLAPIQLVTSLGPSLISFLTGTSLGGDSASLGWTMDAVAWDVLFVLAIVGIVRTRTPTIGWLFPACIVLGTMAALLALPGAPGNDDRHRATQALPFLVVFAMAGLARSRQLAGEAVSAPTSSAARPTTASSSRTQPAR